MKLGLVTNPGSERNKHGLKAMDDAVAGASDILHVHLESIADLPAVLADFARREVGVLAVASGDGTVQATLTSLFEDRPFETPPPLAVLPRGMTNLIAGDVGLPTRPARALSKLMTSMRDGDLDRHLKTRDILRVENLAGVPPQWGMYLGAVGMARATHYAFDQVHSRGVKHQLAVTATLFGLLMGYLLGRGAGEVFRSSEVTVGLDNSPADTRRRILVIVTTLHRLILGSRPFWNLGQGPLRYSAIADPAQGLLRHALTLLYGGPERRLPPESYESRSGHRLELGTDEEVALDGQFFMPRPGQPLVLTAPESVRFVTV